METLLESAIDKHFDLFEIYVLRNTFTLQTELIPYLQLEHHVRSFPLSSFLEGSCLMNEITRLRWEKRREEQTR